MKVRLLVFLWVTALALPAAAAPIVSFDPPLTTVNAGDSFTVAVSVGVTDPGPGDDVADLFAFQFGVSFDPTVLTLTGQGEGSLLPSAGGPGGTLFLPGDTSVPGVVSFIAGTLLIPASASGAGSLALLHFTANPVAITSFSSLALIFNALDGDGLDVGAGLDPNIIIPQTQDGRITVLAVDTTPTPIPEPSTLVLLGTGLVAARRWAKTRRRAAVE